MGTCTVLCGSRAFYRSDFSEKFFDAGGSFPVSPGRVYFILLLTDGSSRPAGGELNSGNAISRRFINIKNRSFLTAGPIYMKIIMLFPLYRFLSRKYKHTFSLHFRSLS